MKGLGLYLHECMSMEESIAWAIAIGISVEDIDSMSLRSMLEDALKKEDYEYAALVRDAIKKGIVIEHEN